MLLNYAKLFYRIMLICIILLFIISLIAMINPYLSKIVIDDAFGNKNTQLFFIILAVMASVQIFKSGISVLLNYTFTFVSQNIIVKLKEDLFSKILKLPFSFFDSQQSSYLSARVAEVNGLNIFFSQSVLRLIIGVLEFVFALIIMFTFEVKLTIILLFFLPVYFFTVKYFSTNIRTISRDLFETSADISRNMQESLAGIEVVKSFSTESRETNNISIKLRDYLKHTLRQNVLSNLSSSSIGLFTAFLSIFILWYFGTGIISDKFTIGLYIAYSGYVSKLFGPVQQFSSMGLTIQPALVSLSRVKELFDLAGEDSSECRSISFNSLQGKIEFKNVNFGYSDKKVLDNVSFKISPGQKIAITGQTGSGKSTIIKLILGFYSPDEGTILIDEKNLENVKLSLYREKIGIISQKIFLFNDTIRNNILYSKPEAEEGELVKVLEISGVSNFIKDLPEGLNTVIGERGTKLSGGQIQLVAIARALLKNPDILIFDEATSNLDKKTESFIFNRIVKEVFKNKTCIIISHRHDSISFVDCITLNSRYKENECSLKELTKS